MGLNLDSMALLRRPPTGIGEVVGESGGFSESPSESDGPKLSRIAQLILAVDSRAQGTTPEKELESRELGRRRLAASLGCTAEDIEEVVESYGETWGQLVLEERVKHGIDSTAMRDISWDRLEGAVLRKLLLIVEADRVSTVDQLLAIAKAANTASRGRRNPGGMGPKSGGDGTQGFAQQVSLEFQQGDVANGVLPAGNLGRIQLTLSHRVQKQIEGTAEETREGRVLDSIEMLNLEAVQEAGEVGVDE